MTSPDGFPHSSPEHHTRPLLSQLRLDPRTHGRGRVPGSRAAAFDLEAFSQAIAHRDLGYLVAHYADDADVRVVDPDHPPTAPRLLHGTAAIRRWLETADTGEVAVQVLHVVEGGDRVAFTTRWHHLSGRAVVATSTAELDEGLITTQHTILAWGRSPS